MEYLSVLFDQWDCLDDAVESDCIDLSKPGDAVNNTFDAWQIKDAITTIVEANHYSVWDIRQMESGFRVELTDVLDDEAASMLCGQFPLIADYDGKGSHETVFMLYFR